MMSVHGAAQQFASDGGDQFHSCIFAFLRITVLRRSSRTAGALNCTDFSIRLSEVAQSFDSISGIQLLVSIQTSPERCPLGTV
jgi:hypothetical protein